MSITSTSFPRPQGYCVMKQCCCEYANSFGYCICTACMKSAAGKTEYITNTVLNGGGGDADDRKQSCTISDYAGSGGRENKKEMKMTEHRHLIDADELMNYCHNTKDRTIDCNDIARFPIVDAEPVRHGRWEGFEEHSGSVNLTCRCQICGWLVNYTQRKAFAYCPNCGARMDGEEQEHE